MKGHGELFKQYADEKNLNKTKLAADLGVTKQSLYQMFKTKSFNPDTIQRIEKVLNIGWESILNSKVNIDSKKTERTHQPGMEVNQPTMQAILDLTYSSRKNADGIEKMADANLINARSIETLVQILAANLSVPNLKGVSPADLQTGDVPVEAFLGGKPLAPQGTPHQGRKNVKDK